MYLTCFYALNSIGHSISGGTDNLLIFLYQFLSIKAQQENRLQAHSFIQEWILSPQIRFPFANRHKYSVTASECTGNNMANCSCDDSGIALKQNRFVQWEAVKLSGLSHCDATALGLRCSQVPWQLHTHMSTTWPKDTSILLTSLRQHSSPTTCYILSSLLIV